MTEINPRYSLTESEEDADREITVKPESESKTNRGHPQMPSA